MAAAFWDNRQLIKKNKNWCEGPALPLPKKKKRSTLFKLLQQIQHCMHNNNIVQYQSKAHTYACITQLKWPPDLGIHKCNKIIGSAMFFAVALRQRLSSLHEEGDSFPTHTNPSSHRLKILYKILSYLSL